MKALSVVEVMKMLFRVLFLAVGSASCALQAEGRTPAIESLQLHQDVRTREVTYVFTPPFTEFVVPIELPFTPDPDAFQSTLLSATCG